MKKAMTLVVIRCIICLREMEGYSISYIALFYTFKEPGGIYE